MMMPIYKENVTMAIRMIDNSVMMVMTTMIDDDDYFLK